MPCRPSSQDLQHHSELQRWILWCILCFLSSLLATSAVSGQDLIEGELEGKFLVAASRMSDPRFRQTVILVIHQDGDGALGLIVNRPVATIQLSELLSDISRPPPDNDSPLQIFYGGPVEVGAGFLLHSPEVRLDSTRDVSAGVALTTDPEMLSRIGAGAGPPRTLMALGYAGWGPGQLDREIAEGGWLTIAAEADMVFAAQPEKTWRTLMDRIVVRF